MLSTPLAALSVAVAASAFCAACGGRTGLTSWIEAPSTPTDDAGVGGDGGGGGATCGGTTCQAGQRCVADACTSGELVLFGGSSIGGPLNDTWTFDGTSWAEVSVSSPPPRRYGAAMASLGSEIVLFGGFDSADLNDTWTFDGASWTQVLASNGPPPRHAASLTTLGSQVVLFGGCFGNPCAWYMNDTWTFDGTGWTQVFIPDPSVGRFGASMAALGTRIVLFGGCATGNSCDQNGCSCMSFLNDTLSFDGTAWTPLAVANPPPPRDAANMVAFGSKVLLFGGATRTAGQTTVLNDTWTFDGATWTQVNVSSPPPARSIANMAALGGEVTLYGGFDDSYLDDTWALSGSSWTQLRATNGPPVRSDSSLAFLP